MFLEKKIKQPLSQKLVLMLVSLVLIAAPLVYSWLPAQAAINGKINYQGKLLAAGGLGTPVADGCYNFSFSLYDDPTSTSSPILWHEDLTVASSTCVNITNGIFSVKLGSIASLAGVDFNQNLYLGVTVGGATSTPAWDSEMSPRRILDSVPSAFVADRANTAATSTYAVNAGTSSLALSANTAATSSYAVDAGTSSVALLANSLVGFSFADYLRANATTTLATSSSDTLLTVNQSGVGNIVDFQSSGVSYFSIAANGNITFGNNGMLLDNSNHLSVGTTTNLGGYALNVLGDTYLTGNATTTGSFNINGALSAGASNLSSLDVSGNVAFSALLNVIGTSTLATTSISDLTVNGNFNAATGHSNLGTVSSTDLTVANIAYLNTIASGIWNGNVISVTYGGTGLAAAPAGYVLAGTGGTSLQATSSLFIDSNGNVGVNTTTPAYKLSVAGNAMISGLLEVGSFNSAGTTTLSGALGVTGVTTLATSTINGLLTINQSSAGSATVADFQTNGNTIFSISGDGTDNFINFSTTTGNGGYGFRSTSGVIQFRDDLGLWTSLSALSGAVGAAAVWATTTDGLYNTNHVAIGTAAVTSTSTLTVLGDSHFIGNATTTGNLYALNITGGSLGIVNGANIGGTLDANAITTNSLIATTSISALGTLAVQGTSTLATTSVSLLTTTGRLGVGVASPLYMMHVFGDTYLDGNATSTGIFTASILNAGTTTVSSLLVNGIADVQGLSLNGVPVNFNPVAAVNVWATSTVNANDIYNVTPGNVGIGTNTPSQLLTVGANLNQQFLVSAAGAVTIIGGSINNTSIGNVTPATAIFTKATSTDFYASGILTVAGTTTLNNILVVSGATTLNNNLTVSGTTNLNNSLAVVGTSTLATTTVTDFTATGTSTLASTTATHLNVSGDTDLLGILTVTRNSNLATSTVTDFTATGTSTLASTTATYLSVSGNGNFGTLNVTGLSTLASVSMASLQLSGTTTLPGGIWQANGLVGMGTSTPVDQLTLATTNNQGLSIYSNAVNNLAAQLNHNAGFGALSLFTPNNALGDIVLRSGSTSWITGSSTGGLAIGTSTAFNNSMATIQGAAGQPIMSALSATGNIVMALTVDGNFGLGTTTPGAGIVGQGGIVLGVNDRMAEIDAVGRAVLSVRSGSSAGKATILLSNNTASTDVYLESKNDGSFGIWQSSNPVDKYALYADPSGNIGLRNNTSPRSTLDLNGGTITMGSANNTSKILFNPTALSLTGGVGFQLGNQNGDGTKEGLDVYGSEGISLYTAQAERLRITSAGNIGVNTTTPGDLLALNAVSGKGLSVYDATFGANPLAQLYNYNDGGRLLLQSTSTNLNVNLSALTRSWINPSNPASGILAIGASNVYSNSAFTVRGTSTNPIMSLLDSSGTPVFYASSSGNIGIGTVVPAYKLDVNGDINIAAESALYYNNVAIARASTTNNNYFNNGAGNMTMTGGNNTANGFQALLNNTLGAVNTANGHNALKANTTGNRNTANGGNTLLANTTGSQNTAIGEESIVSNLTGSDNTAVGYGTLYYNPGSNNTALGSQALINSTAGNNNTAIGYNAGLGLVTGINNTILGANVTITSSTLSNNIIIADGSGNQRINVNSIGNVGIASSTPNSRLVIKGIDSTSGNSALNVTNNSDSSLLFIRNDGNVGIGTSSPSQLLTIGNNNNFTVSSAGAIDIKNGSIGLTGGADVLGLTTRNDATQKTFRIAMAPYNNASNSFAMMLGVANSGSNVINIGGGTATLDAATAINFYTAASVGTTTGIARLAIDTNGQVSVTTTTDSTTYSNGSLITAGGLGVAKAVNIGTTLTVAGTSTLGSLLYVNPGTGFVGIGVSSPISKLALNTGGISFGTNMVNSSARPAIATSTPGVYEIVGYGGSVSNTQDHGFMRLRAGGGGATNGGSYIDISGYNTNADMDRTITFNTTGAERMRIDSGGNVGIGTSSPARKLDILGSDGQNSTNYGAGAGGSARLTDSAGSLAELQFSGTIGKVGAAISYMHTNNANNTQGDLVLSTRRNATDTYLTQGVVLKVSGDVGIGVSTTSFPASRLDVRASSTNTAQASEVGIVTIENTNNTNGNFSGIRFAESNGNGTASILAINNAHSSASNAVDGSLAFLTKESGVGGYPQERMRIDSAGKVGIGTNNPSAQLMVQGTSTNALLNILSNTATSAMYIDSIGRVGIGTASPGRQLAVVGTGDVGYFEYASTTGNGTGLEVYHKGVSGLAFIVSSRDGGAGNIINGLAVKHDGTVGIGTTTPTQKLTVAGGYIHTVTNNPKTTAETLQSWYSNEASNQFTLSLSRGTVTDNYWALSGIFQGTAVANTVLAKDGGKVGIGTTSPIATLAIQGTSTAPTNNLLSIASSSGTQYLTVTPGGNVGIGTTTPGAKLEVNGNAYLGSGNRMRIGTNLNYSAFPMDNLEVRTFPAWADYSHIGGAFNGIKITGQGDALVTWPSVGDRQELSFASWEDGRTASLASKPQVTIGAIVTSSTGLTSSDLYFAVRSGTGDTYPSEIMRITSGGSVGIGTTTPGAKLAVVGDGTAGTAQTILDMGGVYHGEFRFLTDDTANPNMRMYRNDGAGSYSPYQMRMLGDVLAFETGAVTATKGSETYSVKSLSMSPTGMIGIGTNYATTPLDIVVGYPKTDTSTSRYVTSWRSNEGSNYNQLITSMIGGATQANRTWAFQTTESGLSNSGNISFQPYGGNVGIGTTAPGARFEAYSNAASTQPLVYANNGSIDPTTRDFYAWNSAYGPMTGGIRADAPVIWGTQLYSGGSLSLRANGYNTTTPNMIIATNGNIGVGTTNTLSKLYILGSGAQMVTAGSDANQDVSIEGSNANFNTATSPANLSVWSNTAEAADAGASIGLGGRYNASSSVQYGMIKAGKDNSTSGNYSGYLAFGTRLTGNNTLERMRITSGGNIGIGTTNPAAQLNVSGSGTTTAAINDAGAMGGTLFLNDTGGLVGNGGTILFGGLAANNTRFAAIKGYITDGTGGSIGALTFSTRGLTTDTALTERMRIASDGAVGIGTSSPTEILDINGRIYLETVAAPGTTANRLYNVGGNLTWNGTTLGASASSTWIQSGSNLYASSTGWKVGIGSTSPSAVLTVMGTSTATTANLLTISSSSGLQLLNVAPSGLLTVSNNGGLLPGNAMSNTFRTYSGTLGQATGTEISLASLGFGTGNSIALGVRALRTASTSLNDWGTTGIVLGMDVDATVRARYGGGTGASLMFASNGNIGIGATSTPNANLQVTGVGPVVSSDPAWPYGQLAVVNTGTYNDGSNPMMTFYKNRDASANSTITGAIGGYGIWDASPVLNTIGLAFWTPKAPQYLNTTTPAMFIGGGNGTNVGIGTTTPAGKLTIQTAGSANTIEDALRIYYPYNSGGNVAGTKITFSANNIVSNAKDYASISGLISSNAANNEGGSLSFSTMRNGTLAERMRLDNSGDLYLSTSTDLQRYIYLNQDNTGAAKLTIQAGAGSNGYGGAINLYGHSTTSKPGWVVVGISSGAGTLGAANEGRFTVNDQALGGGTDLFTVLRSGKVGIGTTSPLYQLHVYGVGQATSSLANGGNTGATLYLQDYSAGTDNGGAVAFGASGGTGATSSFAAIKGLLVSNTANTQGNLAFSTRNLSGDNALTERMRITYDGNVGIGAMSPGNTLSIQAPATSYQYNSWPAARVGIKSAILADGAIENMLNLTMVRDAYNSAPSAYIGFSSMDDSNNNGQSDAARIQIDQVANGTGYSGGANLSFYTNPGTTTAWNIPAIKRMTILNNGNVGIGITPTAGFEVTSTQRIKGILRPAYTPQYTFFDDAWSGSNDNNMAAGLIYSGNSTSTGQFPFDKYGELIIQGNPRSGTYNSGISLVTGQGTSQAVRMRVDSSGNVGIGSTTPSATLTIMGTSTNATANLLSISSSTGGSMLTLNSAGQMSLGTSNAVAQLYVPGVTATYKSTTVSAPVTGANPYSVYVQGSYAYVTNIGANNMNVIDISNPASPVIVSTIATGASPHSVYVQGSYAYVANSGAGTMSIIDISNPASPVLVSTHATGASPYSVYVQGRYAYVTNNGNNTMSIIDISNPASPVIVSAPATGANPISVYVQGRYAYVANYGASTMSIIDISNPASPVSVGTPATGSFPTSVYVQGRYAYVANYIGNTMSIINISNPASPVLVSAPATGSGPYSIYVQGRYAYVANNGNSTMSIIDISNPASPVLVSTHATGASPYSVYVQGRYAYVPNTGISTMSIIDVGGAYLQQAEIGGLKAYTASIQNNLTVNNDLSVSGGANFSRGLNVFGNSGFYASTTSFMGGNVGIGNNNPNNLLTVGSYNSALNSSNKQSLFSVDNMQLSQLNGGAYFGKVGIKENQWGLANYGNNWTTKATNANWQGVSVSSDGKMQAAVAYSGGLFESSDYGVNWSSGVSIGSNRLYKVAISSDGKIQTAVTGDGSAGVTAGIYVSYDYGSTWIVKASGNSSSYDFHAVAMSSDGKIQTATSHGGLVYVSLDYGNTWTTKLSASDWVGTAMSSDGRVQTVIDSTAGQVYTSTDYGSTWTAGYAPGGLYKVAMSSDGKIQTVISAAAGGAIYVSSDYGANFTLSSAPGNTWTGIAMSSDGKIQTAAVLGEFIYVSSDYGATFTQSLSSISTNWTDVAMSSDGKTQTAALSGGNIYVSYSSSFIRGNIGIGTMNPDSTLKVVGSLCVKSTDAACNFGTTAGHIYSTSAIIESADYAEYFYTNDTNLVAGETVCVDINTPNAVSRCTRGEDPNIMGIVSTNPGVIGNSIPEAANNSNYKIIGMLGQVPAKVSAENGAVNIGDSLTSASSTPGYLMKANPGDSTVGVALEGLASGTGKIQVLISRRNKTVAAEQIEQAVMNNISTSYLQNEVSTILNNLVNDPAVNAPIKNLIQAQINSFNNTLTVKFDAINTSLTSLNASVANLNTRVLGLETQFAALGGRTLSDYFQFSTSSSEVLGIKIGNLANATTTEVAVVEVAASSTKDAFVVNQSGIGDVAAFNNNANATILKVQQDATVAINGKEIVNGTAKLGNNVSSTAPEVAIVEVNASSTATAFVVNQSGVGDVASFSKNDNVEIMNINNDGVVKVMGELLVDGRVMVCVGGVCPTSLDSAVDSTMADMGVEGNVVAGGFQNYCADGYTWVPGSAKFGTMPGFCVMTKKAVQDASGKPSATEVGASWTAVSQGAAQLACQSIGNGYHLISDNEWLTLTDNIIQVGENDINTSTAGLQLATSTFDGSPVALKLNNHATVYDLASGLTAEWTDQTIKPNEAGAAMVPASSTPQEYSNIIDFRGMNNLMPPYYLSSANGTGEITTGAADNSLRGFVRGFGGIFSLDLSHVPVTASAGVGFRCAK